LVLIIYIASCVRVEYYPWGQDEVLRDLVALQQFDGSVMLNAQLCAVTKVSADTLAQLRQSFGSVTDSQLATALAIAFLNSKLSALKAKWHLVEAKVQSSIVSLLTRMLC
jgi:hypothetical protein